MKGIFCCCAIILNSIVEFLKLYISYIIYSISLIWGKSKRCRCHSVASPVTGQLDTDVDLLTVEVIA